MAASLEQRNKIMVAKAQKGDMNAIQYCIDKNIDRLMAEKIMLDMVSKGKVVPQEAAKILKMTVDTVYERTTLSVASRQQEESVAVTDQNKVIYEELADLSPVQAYAIEEEIEQYAAEVVEDKINQDLETEKTREELFDKAAQSTEKDAEDKEDEKLGALWAPLAVETRKKEAVKQLVQDFKSGKAKLKIVKDEKGAFILKAIDFAQNSHMIDKKIQKAVFVPLSLAA